MKSNCYQKVQYLNVFFMSSTVHPHRGQERRNHRYRPHRQEDRSEDCRTLQEGLLLPQLYHKVLLVVPTYTYVRNSVEAFKK